MTTTNATETMEPRRFSHIGIQHDFIRSSVHQQSESRFTAFLGTRQMKPMGADCPVIG